MLNLVAGLTFFRKITSCALLACLLQDAAAQGTAFSVRAGLSVSTEQQPGFQLEESWIPGWSASLSAETPLIGALGLVTTLGFVTKGSRFKGVALTGTPFPYENTTRLGFIQFSPALAWVHRRFYLGAGPYLAFITGGSYTTDALGMRTIGDADIGTTQFDDYQPADWGLHAEAALKLNKWRFGLSFSYGMANMTPTRQGFSETPGVRMLAAQVGVGYVFWRTGNADNLKN